MCLSSAPTTGPIFLKGSNDTSAQGTAKGNKQNSNSAGKNPRSRPVDGFALTGVSNPLDPLIHAYRKDLADTALAGRVIRSHYAEPLVRHLVAAASLVLKPQREAEPLADLQPGDEIRMLDLSRGWAWAYGPDGRVGYIDAEAVGN
jgi:hypothetical protein